MQIGFLKKKNISIKKLRDYAAHIFVYRRHFCYMVKLKGQIRRFITKLIQSNF